MPRGLSPRLVRGDEDRVVKALRMVLRTADEDLMRQIEKDNGEGSIKGKYRLK